jgi:hypothetical protein
MKPTLKAPRIKRLKLKYDKLLSILLQFCFRIQLVPLHQGQEAVLRVHELPDPRGDTEQAVPQVLPQVPLRGLR